MIILVHFFYFILNIGIGVEGISHDEYKHIYMKMHFYLIKLIHPSIHSFFHSSSATLSVQGAGVGGEGRVISSNRKT